MLLFIANSKLFIWASLASLSAQSEIAFITIHLSSILYSLATDNIEKASISQISAQKSTLSLEILSSLSTKTTTFSPGSVFYNDLTAN